MSDALVSSDGHTPKLNEALAKAQGMLENASKDRENPHFKSKYATLASSFDACREALAANGLSIIQNPETLQEGTKVWAVRCVSELRHASGERMVSSAMVIPIAAPHGAQQIGSALSYVRRYQMQSLIGIAQADDVHDDDGNAAQLPRPMMREDVQNLQRQAHSVIASARTTQPLQVETNPQDPRPALSKLKSLAQGYGLVEEMPKIISKVLGTAKTSAQMTEDECWKVINYINLTNSQPKPS